MRKKAGEAMFIVSPVYVQRSYASSEGIYKVHAASKAASASGDEADGRRAHRDSQPLNHAAHHEEPQTAVQMDRRSAGREPNPLDRTSQGKPYSPYGRFKEAGFNPESGYMPQQPFAAEQQKPWAARHTQMVRAYKGHSKR